MKQNSLKTFKGNHVVNFKFSLGKVMEPYNYLRPMFILALHCSADISITFCCYSAQLTAFQIKMNFCSMYFKLALLCFNFVKCLEVFVWCYKMWFYHYYLTL